MLSHQQILHFRTFGFVTLRGLLSPAETATLRQEVTGALADAFGRIATEPNELGGISGDYLPLAANRAPFSLALIADDPRTFQSSAELLGGPAIPSIGIATRFTGDSTWHTRQGPDIGGVTLLAGGTTPRKPPGPRLRFSPWHRTVGGRRPREPRDRGSAALLAVSGFGHCVVAFHAHLMTCAQGGTPRLSWTIDYLLWPGLRRPDQLEVVRDLVLDDVEFDHEDYDRDHWPVWRDWAAGAAGKPSRAIAIERLRLLGVLPREIGADDG